MLNLKPTEKLQTNKIILNIRNYTHTHDIGIK
jgi:hypothetical protein